MMKKLKLLWPVTGVIHVSFLHTPVPIHSAYEDDGIITHAAHLQSCTEKHPCAPFLKWGILSLIIGKKNLNKHSSFFFWFVPLLTLLFKKSGGDMAMPQIQTKM